MTSSVGVGLGVGGWGGWLAPVPRQSRGGGGGGFSRGTILPCILPTYGLRLRHVLGPSAPQTVGAWPLYFGGSGGAQGPAACSGRMILLLGTHLAPHHRNVHPL